MAYKIRENAAVITVLAILSVLLFLAALLLKGENITFNTEAVVENGFLKIELASTTELLNKTNNALISTCKYTSKGSGDFTVKFGPVEIPSETGTTTLEGGIVTCDPIITATSTEE